MFALLWASASTATKIGLQEAQPFVIAQIRFIIASSVMILIAHAINKQPFPNRRHWLNLVIYGILNITLYLGLYVIAMQQVTAGIGSLAVAANPIFISFLSVFFLQKKLGISIIAGIVLGSLGVMCASWPLLQNSSITIEGLILLLLSMLSYSVGAIFYSSKNWSGLSLLTINGWQTFIGGVFLLPMTIYYYDGTHNNYNEVLWMSVIWLAIPVSIFAVQLWLWLLKSDTVRAGLWLYLSPVFGFMLAAYFLSEEINNFTIVGILLVLIGLFIAERETKKDRTLKQ